MAPTPPDAFTQPTPPLARQGLRGGPDFDLTIEGADPTISGEDKLLRALSPFALWAEPPPFVPQAAGPPASVTSYGTALQSVGQVTNRQARRSAEPAYLSSGPPDSTGPQRTDPDLAAPQIADRDTALSIKSQLAAMRETPPLVLLVNPETMSISHGKIASLNDRSRFGFIYQPWGDEPSKVSFTARCGAFYTPGRGVHVKSRAGSAAWQSMMSLLLLYKNNAYVQDVLGGSYPPLLVGRIAVRYDGWTYRGHLDDLSWSEEEQNQLGGIQFQVTMTATTVQDETPYPLTVLPMRGPNGTGGVGFTPAPAGGSAVQGIGAGPPAPPPPPSTRAQATTDPQPFIR